MGTWSAHQFEVLRRLADESPAGALRFADAGVGSADMIVAVKQC